ncbi:hypothetical protein GCM10010869_30210 [Mesorhizobium tianshanense]|uniref:Uncharacterized protein DUF899 n=1 Tax=Mesorhizobium tianshanense TaxID=39844 RepID=A0A562MV22_9HYPH|nr:uncharacterized protein DUF899 [Mesorhizobium tianshanense]GLS37428.1 hypothetical protein GCM10010869_30210 [Mesorhizobium tianshanense]
MVSRFSHEAREVLKAVTTSAENGRKNGQPAMHTLPVVSPQAWKAAREQLLVKEKAQTHARDALAAERRRMPWMAVEKTYAFEGPDGKASLLDLFDGRRQLIVYRAFFEPGVFGWPDHACRGCSLVADQVAHVAHLNARDGRPWRHGCGLPGGVFTTNQGSRFDCDRAL